MSLSFKLTTREAEVLYWVVKGKTNRDIGEILGSSPATAKKHLERVYVKLGVEPRTEAAGMEMSRAYAGASDEMTMWLEGRMIDPEEAALRGFSVKPAPLTMIRQVVRLKPGME